MTDLLDQQATQTGVGDLVGASQQAISKHVYAGTLEMGQTYRDWLRQYCEKLRDEAAGRGGEDNINLTRARTLDASASAELKMLQIKEKAGDLVPVSEIEPLITGMIIAARTELLSFPDKLTNELKALYGVDIDATLIEELIHDVLAHLAGHVPGISIQDDGTSGQGVGSAT